MAEADKLNIDSIIQRLLEGKTSIISTEVAILAKFTSRINDVLYEFLLLHLFLLLPKN